MNQDSKQSEQEQTIEDLKAWYETLPRPGSGQIVEVRLDEIADWHLTHLEAAKRETAKAYGDCTNCYGKGWSSYTTTGCIIET